MEQDVKEKPKAMLRKSVNLKKELDMAAEESGGQDKNGSTKRQHSTSTKLKSTSSPRSSSSTTPSAPLSPSSTSALSTSPPAVTETSKRPTGSSKPSSRASSDSREPRAKGAKITVGGDDGHHNRAAPAAPSSSENPLKKSTRSSSSLAPQLQHSPATKSKSPHPTRETPTPLEEEEDDDSDDDLVIGFPLRPAAQSQPAGKAPGAASKAAAGGKKETRSSGSNSNKESVEEGEVGSGARRRSMDASPAGAVGVAAAAGGKTEPVRRRQPTERRDRSQSARLDVRKRSYTADPRSPTGGGGGQRMSSPNVKLSKEGSHSARESTSRHERDEEANDEEVQSNAGKNRRERNSQDLKKTLSTGSIRTNVEKDASAKDSKSGGSKQSKSNRDLNKLCQEDKADRKKALGEASPTRPARRRATTQSGAITTLRVTKRERKDDDDRPASPGGNRSSRREEAEPAGDEGSADSKRGASAASTTKSRPDSGRDKRERPRGERAKDGGDDQHQAKDSPTSDRRSSRPTSVRISKGADAGGGARKERRHDEESNGGGEDDDSSFLTSSGGITPGRESRTTSSPIDDDDDDEDSTTSYTTPRDHSSNMNGGGSGSGAKSRRMSLKVRENGVSSSEDQRKRGGGSGRRRVGCGNREREESEEEDNKDSKTEEEQDNDGQLDSDEEVAEVEEECMLDAATVEYNARLRKFILACVENLMKTVTRWAVVVSTPFAIAGELRVVDITRYVNGTLVILDGLKLGHRSQRSASGRDLSASKVDKSVQNPIHVAVNILLKKLLKIKNRVNTLSSKRLPHFYQAFYAVQNFHETGEAPRDNSSVHLPLKSTMSDSSIDATLVAAQFGDNPLPTPSPRPNPFEFPSGTDVQVEYMMEPMKCRIGSAGAKNRTLVLQRSNLLVFPKNRSKCKDDKPVKVHDLRNTKTISPSYVNKTATKIKPQSFCVLTVEDEEIEIEAASKETMAAWALALDGLCMPNYSTHLNAQFRSELLQYVGKNVYKGGVIKSSYEEEWSYFANGTLERAEPLNGRRLAYAWDGEVLQPLRAKGASEDDCGSSLGTGRWNGVWLSWYRGDYLSEDPVIRYFWLPAEKEFQTSNPLLTWKWTRHFLASKYGSGEWIMEGEVPSPVVMCLQLMRYAAAIRAEELSRQLTAAPSVLASSRGSKS